MAATEPSLITASACRSTPATFASGCPELAYLQIAIPEDFVNVLSIAITVTSHDQGFSDDGQNFSYFLVSIISPEGHERQRWTAFWNRTAVLEPFTQTFDWPRDVHDQFVMRSFRANDTVRILPKANYQAFRNYVQTAEIHVVGEKLSSVPNTLQPSSIYLPLNAAEPEIRVLRLSPGVGSEISCSLDILSLAPERCPQFEALSYCWGDPQNTKTISVSGHPIQVTSNLHAALNRMRLSTGEGRPLWVDAICINQADMYERAWQVQIMKQIYSAASKVTVWLGDMEQILPDWARPNVQMTLQTDADISDSALRPASADAQILSMETLKQKVPHFEGHISTLFGIAWFSRVWVMQEVFNARAITVLCGEYCFSWSLILEINAHMRRHEIGCMCCRKIMPEMFSSLFALTAPNAQETKSKTPNERLGYIRQDLTGDILDIIIAGLDLDATDPRDKIFALLSFMPQLNLQPDYTKDVSDVFCDFTRWWIQKHRSLRILSAVHSSVGRTWQRLSSLPIPQSRSQRPSWALWYDGKSAWGRSTLGLSSTCSYQASKGTFPDADLLVQTDGAHTKILLLKGKLVSKVASIEPFPYYSALRPGNKLAKHRRIYDSLFDPTNATSAGRDIDAGESLSEAEMNAVEDHLDAHFDFAESNGGAIECHSDSLFSTLSGSEGLCPSQAREGDLIVIFLGGKVPYLVRAVGEEMDGRSSGNGNRRQVEFVGECYLPEYMAGEAMDDPTMETEVFELL